MSILEALSDDVNIRAVGTCESKFAGVLFKSVMKLFSEEYKSMLLRWIVFSIK